MYDQIGFKQLLDFCKSQALRDALVPSEHSVYMALCRSYSARFHTPLAQVYALDPEHVMKEEFASQIDDIKLDDNLEGIFQQICVLEDPNYEVHQEKDILDWIENVEIEEEERIKQGKSIYAFNNPKKEKPEPEKPVTEKEPSRGSVNFSNLDEKNEK